MGQSRKRSAPHAQPQPVAAQAVSPPSAKRPRWFVRFVSVSGVLAASLGAWLIWGPGPPSDPPEKDYPDPGFSSTRYLNTSAAAHYVGVDACTACHDGKHRSYMLTPHSKALADLNPQDEPPDGSFVHAASGRSYRVFRQDGKMRHEEILRSEGGQEIARCDWPIRYRIGSGHFARTYVIEVDGFLHESPITWYASKKRWDMSPGYDAADHQGFERPIKAACLNCHGGRVEPVQTVNRLTLREKAIGCESCHGPGSLHVAERQQPRREAAREDLTIVNPGKLSRPHLEAICSACHLQSVARVLLRGRQAGDFRPGMLLGDYCVDYRFDTGSEHMTVVGHMEQLRASACYKNENKRTEEMTCLTCHNPHPRSRDLTTDHRQKCLSCHTEQSCKMGHAERTRKSPADNCTACHMPRGDTDVPHVAFTHHRIGIHKGKSAATAAETPTLVPLEDVSQLTPLDQQRNLGLAYLQAARNSECAPFADEFAQRARTLLEKVYMEGLREADTTGALADLFLPIDPVRSRKYARLTLQGRRLSPEVRSNALILLAAGELQEKNFAEAARLLKELVPLRRAADDWGMLGICFEQQNQQAEALPAFKQALSIRPDVPAIHLKLAEVYRKLGDAAHALEHQDKARLLSLPHRK